MRKLSMKKLGIPASDEENASGRGGVSVDGEGARRPARVPAAVPGLVCPLALAFDFPRRCPAGADPGVLPCLCWPCTWGVVATSGAFDPGSGGGGGGALSPVAVVCGLEPGAGGAEAVEELVGGGAFVGAAGVLAPGVVAAGSP